MLGGRDHLWRFLPGDEWKKLPECFKAPNRGLRLRPQKKVLVECLQCGKYVTRHRRSARYCSVECRRRADFERDALRNGKPLPSERERGFERRWRARLKGIRKHGSLEAYLRFTEEQRRKRGAALDEGHLQGVVSQGSWPGAEAEPRQSRGGGESFTHGDCNAFADLGFWSLAGSSSQRARVVLTLGCPGRKVLSAPGAFERRPPPGVIRYVHNFRPLITIPRHRVEQAERFFSAGLRPDGATLIFERDGLPWNPNTFGLTFARIVHDAKIPKVRLHDLRYSFASLLLAGGADLKTVSTALGHSTISITADVYAHVTPAMLRDAADLLDRVVESGKA